MNPDFVGVFAFAAMPLEEAKAMMEQDPLVRDGYVKIDAHLWMVADDVIPKP